MKKIAFLLVVSLLVGCGGGGGGGENSSSGSVPIVTSHAATSITPTSAILNGTTIPNGLQTQSWFEYGADSALATYTSSPKQDEGNGQTSQAANITWNGLTAGTTYYFRFCSENSKGTSWSCPYYDGRLAMSFKHFLYSRGERIFSPLCGCTSL